MTPFPVLAESGWIAVQQAGVFACCHSEYLTRLFMVRRWNVDSISGKKGERISNPNQVR